MYLNVSHYSKQRRWLCMYYTFIYDKLPEEEFYEFFYYISTFFALNDFFYSYTCMYSFLSMGIVFLFIKYNEILIL